jgi:hypothetical protein
MWMWMRTTCVPFYDLYWTTRGIEEFEKIFGRKPFTSPDFDAILEEEALEILREEMRKATVHFGEGRMNPSTIASILALIEERVTHHLPSRSLASSPSRLFFETIGMCKDTKKLKP